MIFCINPLFGQEYDWGSLQQYSRALTTDIKSLEVLKDSMLFYDNNDFAKSTAYGLALLNRTRIQNKPILFLEAYDRLAIQLYRWEDLVRQEDFDRRIKELDEMAYDFAIKTGYAPLEARVYVSWAGSSYQKRDSLNISELLHKALGLYREHQHPHEILARTKLFLHNDHSGFGESERFIKHEKVADSLVRLYPASRHIPYYYMARSFDAYYGQEAMGFHKGQMALALEFAQKAIGVSRERRNKSMETYAYLQEASIFLEQGKMAQAHQSLQMAERENHGDFSACNYYYAIIKYEYLSHPEVARYKEAEEIIDEAVHLSKRNVTRYYHDALKRKLEIYFLRNEKKDLLQISTRIDSLARKIYEDENKTSIVTNEVKYKTEILELQNQATQEQLKEKMYNNWVLSMSILALALISMYLLYLYREKNILERKLEEANAQLQEQ
ncbi:MAG: hypothetical protein AB3N16_02985 [Flavobacteriaceae bacterium]